MPTSLEALQAEVSRLSPADRARLLEHRSLEVDAEVDAVWEAVSDGRETDVAAGKATPIPFEEAIARLEARFQAWRHRPRPHDQKVKSTCVAAGMFLDRMRRA